MENTIVVDPIKSGFARRKFIFGIILALLGSGVVVAYNRIGFPMEIRGFTFPEWSVYAVSVLFFIIGIFLVVSSGRGDMCTTCSKVLTFVVSTFSVRYGDKIVHAVLELDAEMIKDLRKMREGEPEIILIMSYCHACRRVARISVKKEEKRRITELVPERVVTGPPVWKFLDAIDKLQELEQE
jgi:hypothetical protein